MCESFWGRGDGGPVHGRSACWSAILPDRRVPSGRGCFFKRGAGVLIRAQCHVPGRRIIRAGAVQQHGCHVSVGVYIIVVNILDAQQQRAGCNVAECGDVRGQRRSVCGRWWRRGRTGHARVCVRAAAGCANSVAGMFIVDAGIAAAPGWLSLFISIPRLLTSPAS